jgi:hypothetical protein
MTWIKLGAYFLNLDHVTSVEVNEHTAGDNLEITVFYGTGNGETGRINTTFTGGEAQRLLRYLESQLVQLDP